MQSAVNQTQNNQNMQINLRKISTGAILALAVGAANLASAQALTGSGSHLPTGAGAYPDPNIVGLSYTDNHNGTFTGVWTATPEPNWVGSVTLTGPIAAGGGPNGTSTFDFSGLANGVLPATSPFVFSDLDAGSGLEQFTFQAYDTSHTLITAAWLDSTLGQAGVGSPSDMPGWNWDTSTSTYTFDGSTVPGNPSVGFYLQNNLDIGSLVVVRDTSFANFAIGAPVPTPEPATLALLGGGISALALFRRRK